MLRSGFFFPKNTLGDGPAFWIFFQDSRIRVKVLNTLLFRANIGIKRHGELSSDNFSLIKGERFTTFDNDQDTWKEGNCATDLRE